MFLYIEKHGISQKTYMEETRPQASIFQEERGKTPRHQAHDPQEIARNNENKTQQYFNLNRNLAAVGSGLIPTISSPWALDPAL